MQVVLDVSEFQSVSQLDSLLRKADDEIVAVYIKATQGLNYSDSLASAFAGVCKTHNTALGYYDFMTNDQAVEQELDFHDFVSSLRYKASVRPMTDAEGAYRKYSAGIANWEHAYGSEPIIYFSLSNMSRYAGMKNPKWVAQYDSMTYYRPSESEIAAYRNQGVTLWQFTDNYMGLNQDASVVVGNFEDLKIPC